MDVISPTQIGKGSVEDREFVMGERPAAGSSTCLVMMYALSKIVDQRLDLIMVNSDSQSLIELLNRKSGDKLWRG